MSKTKSKKKYSTIKLVISLLFFAYVGYVLIVQQFSISEKKSQISAIDDEITQATKENEYLDSQLKIVNTPEYIEKVAREELGYAAPDEIVFVDATSK